MPHFSIYHGVTKMGFNKILSVRPTENVDFFLFFEKFDFLVEMPPEREVL